MTADLTATITKSVNECIGHRLLLKHERYGTALIMRSWKRLVGLHTVYLYNTQC